MAMAGLRTFYASSPELFKMKKTGRVLIHAEEPIDVECASRRLKICVQQVQTARADSTSKKSRGFKELRVGDVLVRKRDNRKPQMNQIRGEQRRAQLSVGMIDMSMNGRMLL